MKIKDKLDNIYETNHYNFCNIDFELYPEKDFIRIYDGENILYENTINKYKEDYSLIEDLIEQEPAKEELRRLTNDIEIKKVPYIVCFYLGKPKEIIEGPISAKIKLI